MTYAFAEKYEVPTIDKEGNIDPEYKKAWEDYHKKYRDYEKCLKEYKHLPGSGLRQCLDKSAIPPKKYGGAYKWALERADLKETEQDRILARFFDGTFNTADLQVAIRISDKFLPEDIAEDSEDLYLQQICESLVDWTSFDIDPGKEKGLQIQRDLVAYLTYFIEGKLKPYSRGRHIRDTFVRLNPNTYTFEKHKHLLVERFKEMYENYGNSFVFENPFDGVELDRSDDDSIKELYAQRQFLFMHALLAFEQLRYIKIERLGNNWNLTNRKSPRHEANILLLEPFEQLVAPEENSNVLSFDPDKSVLVINGKEIEITKFSDQYHFLKVFLINSNDLRREWFFSEIAEQYNNFAEAATVTDDKKFYNAAYQIDQKIIRDTGIRDFFLNRTKQSFQINPKYLI
jgi:hypothetical protein